MGTKRNEEGERENERMKKRKREGDRSTGVEEDIREKRECKMERKTPNRREGYIYINGILNLNLRSNSTFL